MDIKKLERYMKPIQVDALQCLDCKDIIFSRANHDYHHCSCGKISVDGGFEWGKYSMTDKIPNSIKITVDASKAELYDDWNRSIDKYGVIKDGKISGIRRRNRRPRSK